MATYAVLSLPRRLVRRHASPSRMASLTLIIFPCPRMVASHSTYRETFIACAVFRLAKIINEVRQRKRREIGRILRIRSLRHSSARMSFNVTGQFIFIRIYYLSLMIQRSHAKRLNNGNDRINQGFVVYPSPSIQSPYRSILLHVDCRWRVLIFNT